MVVGLGMKLCFNGLILTSQRLTWEQHNSFRPAEKGTEVSLDWLPTKPVKHR